MVKKLVSLVIGLVLALAVTPASAEEAGALALPTCKSFSTYKKDSGGVVLHFNVPTTGHQNYDTNCVLRLGDRGAGVLVLQDALARCLYKITLDGVFGPETANAVRFVQGSNGIPVDGVYGPKTRDVMGWPHYDPYDRFRVCKRR